VTSPFGRIVLVADPTRDRGRVGRELPTLERLLGERGLAHRRVDVREGEGIEAAQRAVAQGDRYLVAVGDDPLVNEVVNGILGSTGGGGNGAARPVLGIVPAGTACDTARTFGLPPDVARAVGHLEGGGTYAIDAAVATFRRPDGEDGRRFFVNAAEAGLGASVVRRTRALPASFGRARRFVGFWVALASTRSARLELTGDRRSWEGQAHDVIVANGQYLGDGYRWAPRSWPSDGYLDVLVMTGPRSDAFTMLQKASLGEHVPSPNILEYKSRRLAIDGPKPVLVHADGVVLGTTPATFEVLPEAVLLKV
jgi:diacylglycerol kinase (ATP)